jgi:hypothetical protein
VNHEVSHRAVFFSLVLLPLRPQVLHLPQHPVLELCGSVYPFERKIKRKGVFHLPDVLFVFSITIFKNPLFLLTLNTVSS